ncbi:hypothetical protein WR25_02435 [Diploscapter pachys]|uniref:Fizzy-related protein homolog n=1 Tax=Diploscapter pachys TaxID=2018661 RepID=A0A2A2KKH5_9BILA|nr:hypothetical protein WR25_02435 [Diploscapter pachys]
MLPPSEHERRLLTPHNPGTTPVNNYPENGSPHVSPTKNHGDRFVPIRQPIMDWNTKYSSIVTADGESMTSSFKRSSNNRAAAGSSSSHLPANSHTSSPSANYNTNQSGSGDEPRQDQMVARALLRNELLQDRIDDIRSCYNEVDHVDKVLLSPSNALFSYGQKTPTKYGSPSTSNPSPFHTPLSEDSQRLLKSPRKPQRKVPKNPYKVLDAPELQDDFYLNLVDWSSQNMLSVGLNTCVYLWSACNSQVIKLCDLATDQDTVTSVQWNDKGDLLAVGTNRGSTQIWDIAAQKKVYDLDGHSSRIGCLAWNQDLICSGSRDRTILQRDIRDARRSEKKMSAHRQEVCGLKWSPDKQLLASGGNDNQLLVWNIRRPDPIQTYTEHNAAVKALAWSPHHHGLLVSGGGTADRCLRFWNTLTGQPLQCIDTGSQVCNVAWSKHSSELVSTHGYSYNQVIIWKYPSLQPVTKLTGHQFRVLYLAMSPDGESIVTGAGDETLRFWHVFSKCGQPRLARSKLNLFNSLR